MGKSARETNKKQKGKNGPGQPTAGPEKTLGGKKVEDKTKQGGGGGVGWEARQKRDRVFAKKKQKRKKRKKTKKESRGLRGGSDNKKQYEIGGVGKVKGKGECRLKTGKRGTAMIQTAVKREGEVQGVHRKKESKKS